LRVVSLSVFSIEAARAHAVGPALQAVQLGVLRSLRGETGRDGVHQALRVQELSVPSFSRRLAARTCTSASPSIDRKRKPKAACKCVAAQMRALAKATPTSTACRRLDRSVRRSWRSWPSAKCCVNGGCCSSKPVDDDTRAPKSAVGPRSAVVLPSAPALRGSACTARRGGIEQKLSDGGSSNGQRRQVTKKTYSSSQFVGSASAK